MCNASTCSRYELISMCGENEMVIDVGVHGLVMCVGSSVDRVGFAFAFLGSFGVMIIWIWLCQSTDGFMKILMFLLNMLYLLFLISFQYTAYLSLLQFDFISFGTRTCVIQVSQETRDKLSMLSPIWALSQCAILASLYYGIVRVWTYWCRRIGRATSLVYSHTPFLRAALGVLLFNSDVTYTSLFRYMTCTTVSDRTGTHSFVTNLPAISCDTPSYVISLALHVVYALLLISVQIIIFIYLIRPQQQQHSVLSLVYATYKRKWYLYEIVMICRRVIIISISVAMQNDVDSMYRVLAMVIVVFLIIHISCSPFVWRVENDLETWSLFNLFITCVSMVPASTSNTWFMVLIMCLIITFMFMAWIVVMFKLHDHVMEHQHDPTLIQILDANRPWTTLACIFRRTEQRK